MDVTVLVHEAEEGGYWAEVAEFPGCMSSGESLDELRTNIDEAMEAWLDAWREDFGPELPRVFDRWQLPVPESALQPAS